MKLAELLQKHSESLDSKVDKVLTSNQVLQKSMDQSMSSYLRSLLIETSKTISSSMNLLSSELTRGINALKQAEKEFQDAQQAMMVKFRQLTGKRNRIDGLVAVAAIASVVVVMWYFGAMRNFFNDNFPLFWHLTMSILGVMLLWLFGFFHWLGRLIRNVFYSLGERIRRARGST